MFSLAVFLQPMSDATGWSRTGISSAMTLDFLTMGVAAFGWGALSDRFRGERIHAIESFGIDGTPSTKTAVNFLTNVVSSKNVLVVIERNDDVTLKSIRNLSNLHVLTFDQLNAYDVLVSDDIVFTQAALEAFIASKSGANQEVSA